MKKSFNPLLWFLVISLLAACNTATPEQYFDQAVLNTNMEVGFAGEGLYRQFESPSVKLNQTTGQTEPMKRSELIDDKIAFAEESLKKIKDLRQTDDTKEMLQASIALYEFVLPVYKTEYRQLAKLYDTNSPKEETLAKARAINDKYALKFEELYKKLLALGKPYAAKHNIKVDWTL